jgi:hypothetical protein
VSDGLFESADLPPGTYTGTLIASRIVRSLRTKNVGVMLLWEIPRQVRAKRVWRTLWLSPAALPRTKRELARLGVRTLADLDNDPPVRPGALCRLVIAGKTSSDGCYESRIVSWEVLSSVDTAKEVTDDERG